MPSFDRNLDLWVRPRLNFGVRALVISCVVLASVTAWAKPRVQVAPFAVKSESLGYFGPEVARAVAAALEGAGVETGAGAPDTIVGRVDELPGERVRLTATLRQKTLSAEGPLEAVDAVATSLANKMAPLLLENDPAAQKLAEKRARDAEKRAASVPPSRPAPRAARKPEVATSAGTKPETKPPVEEAPPPPAPEPSTAETPSTSAPEPAPEAKAETKPEPPKPEWVPPRVDTPPPPPRVQAEPPVAPTPPPYLGGFVRGRVVAHAIAEPPGAYPTAGVMATQALFAFLHRRVRLTVIPTGVGITSTGIAADEAYRAAARAVVMARLDGVEFLPGPAARVRLEVVVVRDGRPVMRRVIESVPSDVGRRPLASDPIYQSVTMALEALVPELVGALADVR